MGRVMVWKVCKLLDRVLVKKVIIEVNEFKLCNFKENNGWGMWGKNSVGGGFDLVYRYILFIDYC